jgi:hypothetical protein
VCVCVLLLCLPVNMRLLLYPRYGDVTFGYQSSGCYSGDMNIDMVLKHVQDG